MAALTIQQLVKTGLDVTFAAASAGGDTFVNNGKVLLVVKNGGGAPINVTVDSVRACDQGFDHDLVVAVPAGQERKIGFFEESRFGGQVSVAYSAVASVTVAAIRVG